MFNIFKTSAAATSVASFLQTFDLGEASVLPDDKHVFGRVFCHATHRPSGKRVTVFVCESPARAVVAAAAVKRIKTLRHPAVPLFVDAAVDSDRVAMAVEPVTILSKHLADTDGSDVAWGLFQVLKGIAFLANDAHLVHGGLHGDAIFVSEAGDWKIFALERMLQGDASPSSLSFNPELLPYGLQKYNPPEMSDPGKRSQTTAWSTDMWGFGCIIWETFNGPLPAAKNLAQMGSIPKAISSFYMECVAANPSKRPNPKDRLETMRRPGGYFKNDLIDTLVFLEEFQIKEDADKARFFGHLQTALDSFPVHICKGKILPELIKSFEFGNAGAAVIGPILRLGKLLDSNDYVEKVVPCVLKVSYLFTLLAVHLLWKCSLDFLSNSCSHRMIEMPDSSF
jgi:SCY1-like protein 1